MSSRLVAVVEALIFLSELRSMSISWKYVRVGRLDENLDTDLTSVLSQFGEEELHIDQHHKRCRNLLQRRLRRVGVTRHHTIIFTSSSSVSFRAVSSQ
jgi:hypothetical protein